MLWKSATWQAALENESGKYAGRTIESYSHRPTFELYNIQEDPMEWNNLAYKAEYINVLEELKTKLKNFQERTMDPWIVKWEHE
jgi:N-sulfoglucosamine sulfohydrolase